MKRTAAVLFVLFLAAPLLAQQPLFDPDDFVAPRQTGGRPVFISRIVIGGASNLTGSFRPLGDQIGFVHLSNSFYWRMIQVDYKRSEQRAEDGQEAVLEFDRSDPTSNEPVRVQTRNATPRSNDILHAAVYWPVPGTAMVMRSRATWTTETVESHDLTREVIISPRRDANVRSGRERTFALDTDTWFRIARRDVFGSIQYSSTKTSGAGFLDRDEKTLTYTNRFPALTIDRAKLLIRPALTVGGVSNRGSSGVNVVSPAIEVLRPFVRSGANLHVVYAPQWSATGDRWTTAHQVAVFIDRALFVKVF